MTKGELIKLLLRYHDWEHVVIECDNFDYEVREVYKDGKGDICLLAKVDDE